MGLIRQRGRPDATAVGTKFSRQFTATAKHISDGPRYAPLKDKSSRFPVEDVGTITDRLGAE